MVANSVWRLQKSQTRFTGGTFLLSWGRFRQDAWQTEYFAGRIPSREGPANEPAFMRKWHWLNFIPVNRRSDFHGQTSWAIWKHYLYVRSELSWIQTVYSFFLGELCGKSFSGLAIAKQGPFSEPVCYRFGKNDKGFPFCSTEPVSVFISHAMIRWCSFYMVVNFQNSVADATCCSDNVSS